MGSNWGREGVGRHVEIMLSGWPDESGNVLGGITCF